MSSWRRWLRISLTTCALVFLAHQAWHSWEGQPTIPALLSWSSFLVGSGLLGLIFFADGFGWALICHCLRMKVNTIDAILVWVVSSLSRYVPGYVWSYVSRADLATELGLAVPNTIRTMMYETYFLVLGACLAAASFLFIADAFTSIAWGFLFASLAMGLVIMSISKSPLVKRFMSLKWGDGIDSARHEYAPLRHKAHLAIAVYYTGLWIIFGVAFALFCASFVSLELRAFAVVAAAWAATFVVTSLVPILPAGLLMREATLLALLPTQMPLSDAIAITALSRLWTTAFEMGVFGFAVVARKTRRKDSSLFSNETNSHHEH
jgi:hypothetical protein